ncbi:MAG TPA: MgtC/SapB family protein [Anaeromyxobacteraceae bacterium]|nr:MgtC/SapB family protein [Anaeromyxobacteraceae bacterium]
MNEYEPYVSLGLAAVAGLLIGLERERSAPDDARDTFIGGARTHPLFALVGGVATLAAHVLGPWVVALPLAALVALLVVSYQGDVRRDRSRGITSEAAFLLSYLLGVLACTQGVLEPPTHKVFVVAGAAVVATFLLSSKPTTHRLARTLSREDVASTMKFLVVGVVILPLLPDRTYGPLDVLNPFTVGAMLVLISALSFAGYVAIRLLGPERGLGLTGVVGGLVSSTAVTLSMSGRAREKPEVAGPAALAVVLASTIMFARILAIVAVVSPSLVPVLAWPMGGAALAGLAWSLFLWLRSRAAPAGAGAVTFTNPFELGQALQFALLFAVVLLGSKFAALHLGTAGTYAAGLLAGSTDVDAITLSMAKLAGGPVTPHVAATTIFLGAASNTLVKAALARTLGGGPFGRRVALALGATLAAGAGGVALAWAL